MALGIKKLVTQIPEDSYRPGDVYITNDPSALAGHLNDVCVFSPIFHQGKLTAFTACVFHHSNIGGRVFSDNHDVYEDGLFIPLVKLYDADRINELVVEMIKWNVRTPDEVIGDIRSQIAANHVCAEKICQMLVSRQACSAASCLPFFVPASLRFQSHSTTMQLKTRLAGPKNCGAILRHFMHDATLEGVRSRRAGRSGR